MANVCFGSLTVSREWLLTTHSGLCLGIHVDSDVFALGYGAPMRSSAARRAGRLLTGSQ